MFSTTIKRSVATLGVVAGLLAAAGPASAQILDGPVLGKAGPQPEAGGYLATDPSSEVDNSIRGDAQDTQTRRASSLKDTLVSGYNFKAAAEGTPDWMLGGLAQVGSEGVKDDVPLETVSFTFKGEVIGLEPNALGTQVGSEGVKAPANADAWTHGDDRNPGNCCD
jgi:hypothetical protein